MRNILPLAALALLAACSPQQTATVTAAARQTVADGQLFCGMATVTGPLVVAVADAAGAPVSVIGKTGATVAAVCAAINAIPVVPPAGPVPTVAVPVAAAPAASAPA